MQELNDFYNAGFGWICRHCERELARTEDESDHARFFLEGEAESKSPRMSNPALARWQDAAQTLLMCPRCSVTEPVSKA